MPALTMHTTPPKHVASARAMSDPMPKTDAPALTEPAPIPSRRSSARATVGAEPRVVTPALTNGSSSPKEKPSARADPLLLELRVTAELLDRVEAARMETSKRLLAFQRDRNVTMPHLDVILEEAARLEHQVILELQRAIRRHPLAAWQKSIHGLGEKQFARLISELGDPADRKTVSQLWAYCGFDPNRRRRKGMSQDQLLACGNPRAKSRAYLVGRQFVKMTRSPYRPLYDSKKAEYLERGWTRGHADNAAVRFITKRFLRDLWVAAREARA
jgi:hypothetical protein